MLSEETIAHTIIKLQQAGKRMPQEPQFGKDQFQEKMRILKETVDLWKGLFKTTGLDRWQQAEQIALTMTSANGLNVNVISPALMQAALKQAEEAYVQDNIARNNADDKQADWVVPLGKRINSMLLLWTRQKLKEHRPIMPYMPTDRAVFEYGRKLGLSDNAIDEQLLLIKCYINDWQYSQESGRPCASRLTRVGDELTLELIA